MQLEISREAYSKLINYFIENEITAENAIKFSDWVVKIIEAGYTFEKPNKLQEFPKEVFKWLSTEKAKVRPGTQVNGWFYNGKWEFVPSTRPVIWWIT